MPMEPSGCPRGTFISRGRCRMSLVINLLVVLLVALLSLIIRPDCVSAFPTTSSSLPLAALRQMRLRTRTPTIVQQEATNGASSVNGARPVEQQQVSQSTITPDDESFYIRGIEPKTVSLSHSMRYYARFVATRFRENRKEKLELRRQKQRTTGLKFWKRRNAKVHNEDNGTPKGSFMESLQILNQQRRNIVQLAGYKAPIVVPSFLFLILSALLTSITPHFYSDCITCVATMEPSRLRVVQALTGLAVSSTLAAFFAGARGSLFWIAGSRANYNVRVKLHRNLLLQEAAFFDSNETGYLLSRLNNDVNKIGQVISFHVNVVLRQFAQFMFGSVYLVRISPRLSMWAFAGIFLVAVVAQIYGTFARDLAQRVQNTFADATAVAETSFSMSETVRAFDGVESEEYRKYEGAQGKALRLEEIQAWAYGSHKFISDGLQTALQVALLFACWSVGRAGGLSASKLTTFMFYTNFVLESSNEVGDQWAKIQSAIGASTNVFDLVRRIPTVRDPTIPAPPIDESAADVNGTPIITMSNMTVMYNAMDAPALKEVNLNVYEGDRIAIVGRSGSGKSSMLRTMLRFYDPSSGSCSLYGRDLKDITRRELASKVTVVEQEPHLFPMSLMENVLYGYPKDATCPDTGKPCYSEGSRTAVAASLKRAGLPVGENNDLGLELGTRVGEGGRTLSGGQRQRATIARALIRKPEVLLLDEPTAALDSQSEKKVVKALEEAMKATKCMIMVTHRLGVVRSLGVNRVLVLEKGRIVESGDPEELLQQEGSLYGSLALEQGITARSEVSDVSSHKSYLL